MAGRGGVSRLWVDSVKQSKCENRMHEMLACFDHSVIMKSLKQINGVMEMKQQIVVLKQFGTGAGMLLRSLLDAHFDMWEVQDWHAGSLDAPETMPAGSSIRDEHRYLGVCNAPSLFVRGS